MSRWTVAVTERFYDSYADEESVLRDVDAAIMVHSLSSREEAIEALRDADGILVHQFPVDEPLVCALRRCQIISRYGIGMDNVDVAAASRAGIWVSRVPDYGADEAVSDQALALLLGCVRKVAWKDRRIRAGGWQLQREQRSFLVKGKTLGIVGFGSIGRIMARKCSSLGLASILVHDPVVDPARIAGAGCVATDLDRLLRESDFISLHAPLGPATAHLVDHRALSLMKSTAILVNTARGGLVDERALCDALEAGRIQGAGLDVFESEPLAEQSRLRSLDTVILSDHAGYYAEETLRELRTKAAQNVAAVLAGGEPITPVNRPEPGGRATWARRR